jgi:O-antigen biosynthesis protein
MSDTGHRQMMPQAVSVIIVSRHRAAALLRCLVGLGQQDHTNFEVIVVADPEAVAAVEALPQPIKLISFDHANISAARNLGLAQAAGSVVAFIDDDAVPEPSWLSRLVSPFQDREVVAATGFVRGRNGISYQWKACEVDGLGDDHDLNILDTTVVTPTAGRAVKTQGTNCAFRTETLRLIGGFDPAYRFYLDDADVDMRLVSLGKTAVVPEAQVHHGYQASARRAANRVPLSLYDIAASTAIFLRRHAVAPDFDQALAKLSRRESARINHHRAAGRLDADAELALLHSMAEGWKAGLTCVLADLGSLSQSPAAFLSFPSLGPMAGKILSGRFWQKSALRSAALTAVGSTIVTVICLSPTARPHRMEFQPEGFWLQTGGLFGRSDRSSPKFRLIGFRKRIRSEICRISKVRPIG